MLVVKENIYQSTNFVLFSFHFFKLTEFLNQHLRFLSSAKMYLFIHFYYRQNIFLKNEFLLIITKTE